MLRSALFLFVSTEVFSPAPVSAAPVSTGTLRFRASSPIVFSCSGKPRKSTAQMLSPKAMPFATGASPTTSSSLTIRALTNCSALPARQATSVENSSTAATFLKAGAARIIPHRQRKSLTSLLYSATLPSPSAIIRILRTRGWVRRVLVDSASSKPTVRGVTYVDGTGEEIFQPASLVFLASWTFNNTRLLLLSGIGEPYDPATGRGTVGSNLTHQVTVSAATAFFDQPLNRFMGSGSAGILFSDFDGDDLDRSSLNFIRGGYFAARGYGFQPIGSFGVLPNSIKATWGSEWKKAAVSFYDRTATIGFSGEHLAYKTHFMDLDPTYKDALGDPLLRLTLDWRDNERKMAEFATPKAVEVARAMGAREINPFPGLRSYDS